MRDVELYKHLLGVVDPWTVERVEMSVPNKRVDVWVDHPKGAPWACPTCLKPCGLYDHEQERAWRHLDSCHFQTYLHARPPRVNCAEHGVTQARLPWAEPSSRFTAMFERLAIDVLQEASVEGAAKLLGLSWDETMAIMQRAVARGLIARKPAIIPRISVDEKSVGKGQDYFTIVSNIDEGTVLYVGDQRKTESLDLFYETLSKEQLAGIQAVGMDMWEPFFLSTMVHVPDAANKIVFDRYHVMQHMGMAVDTVRKRENRDLIGVDDKTLSGSKYIWLYSKENLPAKHRARFNALMSGDLKTARAWAIKENLRHLWEYKSPAAAKKHWTSWNGWAMRSRLQPVKDVAKMIKSHLANVLTFATHRITSATSEGLNSKIQTIKKKAYGYRNKNNFRTSILFHCGGLALYPMTHGNVG